MGFSTDSEPIDAVILRMYPSAESDLLLHVLTPSRGKMTLFARSARKARKRSTPYDLFEVGIFEVRETKPNFAFIQKFTPTLQLRQIRDDLAKVSAASVLCESFDLLVPEQEERAEELYRLLLLGLEAMNTATSQRETFRALFLAIARLLAILGYHDDSTPAPSAHGLAALLNRVEVSAERDLLSKQALLLLVRDLRAPEETDAKA